jgi:hypothetical protein
MTVFADIEGDASALLILTSAIHGKADHEAFNKWYDEVHVPDLLTIPEFQSARRYRVSDARLFPGQVQEPNFEYVAIYRIKAADENALRAAAKRVEELGMSGISQSDAFDYSRVTATYVLPISDEIEKDPKYERSRQS